MRDILPATAACSTSRCSGSAALLTLLDSTSDAPSLALSSGDLPNVTLTNLGSAGATGLSITATGYSLSSDCDASLPVDAQCSVALGGSAVAMVRFARCGTLGARDVVITGFSQTAALSISATELDFGTQSPLAGALRLRRYLFLSNNSNAAVTHATVALPASWVFAVTDTAHRLSSHTLSAGSRRVEVSFTPMASVGLFGSPWLYSQRAALELIGGGASSCEPAWLYWLGRSRSA